MDPSYIACILTIITMNARRAQKYAGLPNGLLEDDGNAQIAQILKKEGIAFRRMFRAVYQ